MRSRPSSIEKTTTSKEVEIIGSKMASGEDCVAKLHALAILLAIVPGVQSSPYDKGDNHDS
jgi:hypothetical protein